MQNMEIKRSHIVIESWMISELHLKGLERDIYAIIYGYSKDKQGFFVGKLKYFEFWTGATKMGVSKALKNLIEKKYIVKSTWGYNKVAYQAVLPEDIKPDPEKKKKEEEKKEKKKKEPEKSEKNAYKRGVSKGENTEGENGKLSLPRMVNSVYHHGKLSLPRTYTLINTLNNNINSQPINTCMYKDTRSKSLADKKTTPPSLDQVKAYAKLNNLRIDPEKFYNKNSERHWIDIYGEPIRDWKKVMDIWSENERAKNIDPGFKQNTYDFDALEAELIRN
jgi:hypothetical protein